MKYRTVYIRGEGDTRTTRKVVVRIVDVPKERQACKTMPHSQGFYHFTPSTISDDEAFNRLRNKMIENQLIRIEEELEGLRLLAISKLPHNIEHRPLDLKLQNHLHKIGNQVQYFHRRHLEWAEKYKKKMAANKPIDTADSSAIALAAESGVTLSVESKKSDNSASKSKNKKTTPRNSESEE